MANGTKIGDAFVDVHADTTDAERDIKNIEKTAVTSGKNATAAFAKFGPAVAIGAAAAGAAVVSFAKDSVAAAVDLNESINAVNVTFGESAEAVHALAESASTDLGLAQADFNSLAVASSAFVESIAGITGSTVPDVLDTLTTRVADFASVMNLDVADAFTKFRSGLAGESEPLRQFGIDVSQARIEQVALAEGLINTGEEMTEAEKVTARYLAIMEQTEKTAGDFANTSDGLANSSRKLAAQFTELQAQIGNKLVPFLEDLVGLASDVITSFTGSEMDAVAAWADGATESAEAFLTVIALGEDDLDGFGNGLGNGADQADQFEERVRELAQSLPDEELRRAQDGVQLLVDKFGLTTQQAEILSDVLVQELAGGLTDSEQKARDASVAIQDMLGDKATEPVSRYGRKLEGLKGDMDTLTTDADEVGTAFGNQERAIDRTVGQLGSYEEGIRRLTDPVFKALDDQARLRDAHIAHDQAIDDLIATQQDEEATLDDLAVAEQAVTDTAFDLVDAQLAADGSAQGLGDSLGVVADQVRITGERAGITTDILGDMDAAILALDGRRVDIEFAIKRTGAPIDINTILDAEFGDINRQHGGPVSAGFPYRVGEVGPELFVPDVDGRIIPNDQLTSTGVGTTVNVTIPGTGTSTGDAVRVAQIINTLVRP